MSRKYYQEHRAEILAQQREYYAAHRAKKRAYAREYRKAHKAEQSAYNREYRNAHRDEILARKKVDSLKKCEELRKRSVDMRLATFGITPLTKR